MGNMMMMMNGDTAGSRPAAVTMVTLLAADQLLLPLQW
jgi:hypothetical protein